MQGTAQAASEGVEERWEYGSELHWLTGEDSAPARSAWEDGCVMFGSGRDAFRALLDYGQETRGWRRLWIPSYFCQEVVEAFLLTGIEVRTYPYGPGDSEPGLGQVSWKPGDVLLRMNFFGLRGKPPEDRIDRKRVEVIDNHTHDPWSDWALKTDADWCVASLRKTLPVPDGGVVWSPRGHRLPPRPRATARRKAASLEKLAAMMLKRLYLEGQPVDKEVFRALALSGESNIAAGAVSGMPEWTKRLLPRLPLAQWRARRLDNHRTLSIKLADLRWVRVLQPDGSSGGCPYSGILVFDSPERRDRVREALIARGVYPSVLWNLDAPLADGVPGEHVDFSRRMLSLHCDMRYSRSDVERAAGLVHETGADDSLV